MKAKFLRIFSIVCVFVLAFGAASLALADAIIADADQLVLEMPNPNGLVATQPGGTTVSYSFSAAIRNTGNANNDVFPGTVDVTITKTGEWVSGGTSGPWSFTAYEAPILGTIQVTVPCGKKDTVKTMSVDLKASTRDSGKSLNPDSQHLSFTITAGSDDPSCTSQPPTNHLPVVAVDNNTVAVDEGATASNTGTWSDVDGDVVVISASAGTIVKNEAGTWDWSFDTTDGPVESQTVTIAANDGKGGVSTTSFALTVNNVSPTPSLANAPASSAEGTEISFDGSATDPSPVDTATGFTYAWSVTKDGNLYTSGNGATIAFTPDDNATYVVTLSATDKDSGTEQTIQTIAVTNVPPMPLITGALDNNLEGTEIILSGSATDPSSVDTAAGFIYEWSVTKGGIQYASGNGSTIAFTPDDNGTYVVTLYATDKDGDTGQGSKAIIVTNVPPVVVAGAVSGSEGSAVSEDASFTDAGTADTHTCLIDWGDETSTNGKVVEDKGVRTCSGNHTYADNGSYPVIVTVTDDDGGEGSDSDTATIANVNPIVATPLWASTTVNCRVPAKLTGISFSDPGVLDKPWNVNIAWGDGSAEKYETDNQGAQSDKGHTYNTPGSYTATVGVTDKDKGYGSANSAKITVLQTYTIKFLQPFDGSTVSSLITNTMKSGRVVPVKVTIYDDCAQNYVTDPSTIVKIAVSLTANNGLTSDEVETYADAGASNSNTWYFRWTSDVSAPGGGFWIYNLDSKTAGAGGSALAIGSVYKVDVYVGSVKATVNQWALLKPIK